MTMSAAAELCWANNMRLANFASLTDFNFFCTVSRYVISTYFCIFFYKSKYLSYIFTLHNIETLTGFSLLASVPLNYAK